MLIGIDGFDHFKFDQQELLLELKGLFSLLERLDGAEKKQFQAEMQSIIDSWSALKDANGGAK